MSFDRQVPRAKPSLEETRFWQEIPDVSVQSTIERNPLLTNAERIVLNLSTKESLAQADLIERLMIEGNSDKQRRRRQSSLLTSNYSNHIDQLLKDGDNDWVYEKLLEKFENLQTRKTNRPFRSSSYHFDDDDDDEMPYGVERIVERRYYVKRPGLESKRNQLTSTTDLTGHEKKHRQLSGASSASCSGCSTPTYVESLRIQSKTLRDEIIDLRQEIEHLHTSQEEFFHDLKTQFHAKPNSTTDSQQFVQPVAAKNGTSANKPVSVATNQRTRSISTDSQASITSASQTTSRQTTPTTEFTTKPPVVKPPPAAPPISEFLANKNPSLAPAPPASVNNNLTNPVLPSVISRSAFAPLVPTTRGPSSNTSGKLIITAVVPKPPDSTHVNVRSPSISSVSTVNSTTKNSRNPAAAPLTSKHNSKPSSVASTTRTNTYVNVRNPSVSPLSTVNSNGNARKTASVASTSLVHPYVNVGNPSVGPTPPVGTYGNERNPLVATTNTNVNQKTPSGTSLLPKVPGASTRPPIYENEPTLKRVLSPRSQIVASSAAAPNLSESSSESVTPGPLPPNQPKISKVLSTSLRDNEMQALTQYSSQLATAGFVPAIAPVITNPNTSSTFWDSVDEFIHQSGARNTVAGLPPIPPANRFGPNYTTTRQLDKYDLEIKPHEFIESSVPFLMPPLDSLP